jgi:hypothetical protein
MSRWEYLLVLPRDVGNNSLEPTERKDLLEAKLNELGAEGWELVGTHDYQYNHPHFGNPQLVGKGHSFTAIYLKRPIEDRMSKGQ